MIQKSTAPPRPRDGVAPPPGGEAQERAARRQSATSELAERADVAQPAPPPSPRTAAAPGSRAASPHRRLRADAAAKTAGGATTSARPAPQAAEGMERNEARLDLVRSSRTWVFSTSPDGASMWRLPEAGGIEHSTDGGRTWRAQRAAPRAELLALRAVDAITCWAAGQGRKRAPHDGRRAMVAGPVPGQRRPRGHRRDERTRSHRDHGRRPQVRDEPTAAAPGQSQ